MAMPLSLPPPDDQPPLPTKGHEGPGRDDHGLLGGQMLVAALIGHHVLAFGNGFGLHVAEGGVGLRGIDDGGHGLAVQVRPLLQCVIIDDAHDGEIPPPDQDLVAGVHAQVVGHALGQDDLPSGAGGEPSPGLQGLVQPGYQGLLGTQAEDTAGLLLDALEFNGHQPASAFCP